MAAQIGGTAEGETNDDEVTRTDGLGATSMLGVSIAVGFAGTHAARAIASVTSAARMPASYEGRGSHHTWRAPLLPSDFGLTACLCLEKHPSIA